MNYKIVVYSHSSYFDVLDYSLHQLMRYFKEQIINIVADKNPGYLSNRIIFTPYDEKLTYKERLKQLFSFINKHDDNTPILFLHEDFILYAKPAYDILEHCAAGIKEFGFDFIRLIYADCYKCKRKIGVNKLEPDSPYIFAVQPTLWNPKSMLRFLNSAKGNSIYELELEPTDQLKNGHIITTGTERKIGQSHYESIVFPYMATAITKGKWNPEYKKEIEDLNIDTSIRGWA